MKVGRQSKIIELITENNVETQEELAELLEKNGYPVTQATISRDIRELKLTKIAAEDGGQKYIVLQPPEAGLAEKYVRVLRDGFLSMDTAQNILVIKTVSGMAMAVAAALDAMHIEGMVGCIAGDDTIMCAIRTLSETPNVMEKISRIVSRKQGHNRGASREPGLLPADNNRTQAGDKQEQQIQGPRSTAEEI